jgi:hypothetical protein
MTNLVDRPEYAALVAKLDSRTTGLLAEAGDPEDPVRIAKLIQNERRARGLDDRAAELLPARVEPGSGFRGATV